MAVLYAANYVHQAYVMWDKGMTSCLSFMHFNHFQVAPHRLSVVIVDRTLDLCSPASVDSKCFLDKMLCALPHLPDHTNDVAVNMSQLAQVTV